MPISQTNQVDYLFKKIGYSVAKSANATVKSPSNETVASPLTIRGDNIWIQSGSIPATPPGSSSGVVTVYSDANTNSVKTTADATSPTSVTWKTGITNWIDPSFNSNYAVKIYLDTATSTTPQSTGTQLFPDGTGNSDEWFFDYDAGTVNFPDNIPSVVTANPTKVLYVVGYTYSGLYGIANSAAVITGTVNTANVSLYTNVTNSSTNYNYNLLFGNTASGNTQVFDNTAITYNPNTGNLTVANVIATHYGNMVGNVITPTQTLITTVGTLTNLTVAGNTTSGNVLSPNGNIGNLISNLSTIATGNITTINSNLATVNYINNNVLVANTATIAGLTVTANATVGNLYTTQANLTTVIATGNITATNFVGVQFGNVNTNNIIGGTGTVNIIPGTTGTVNINSTTAMLIPSGTQTQRPTGVAGYIRYNQNTNIVEYYNGSAWIPVTTTVSDQTFNGDGSTTTFNLTNTTNAAGILVSINGVVQNPVAYSVNGPGTQITFTETPLSTDVIDIRYLSVAVTNNGTFATDVTVTGNITITGLLSSPLTTKTSTSPGTAGQIAYDANYIYVCTATNTWKRVALTGGVF